MTINITTTDQAVQNNGMKVLVYGRAGMGKTTLASTAPAPIILAAEGGLLSVRQFKLPVIEVKTYAAVMEVAQWAANSREAAQFQTIILDSLSEILEVVLATEKAKPGGDPRQAYGRLIDTGIPLIRFFRDLPRFNVVMIAKEFRQPNAYGAPVATPRAPGQSLGIDIPYMYDLVARAATDAYAAADGTQQVYHYLQCRPDPMVEAKDRSGRLDMREPPNLGHIFGKMLAAY